MTIAQGQIGLLADYATSIVKRVDKDYLTYFMFFFFLLSRAFHTSIGTSLKWGFSPLLIKQQIPLSTACCNFMQGLFVR